MLERTPQERSVRQDQILTAAARLIRQRGFAQVSVDDIGGAVGFSGPALYRYFPSKQSVLEHILTRYLEALGREHDAQSASGCAEPGTDAVNPPASNSVVLTCAIAAALRDPDGFVVLFRDLWHLDDMGRAVVLGACARFSAPWQWVLPRLLDEPESDPVRELRVHCMAGVLMHIVLAGSDAFPGRAALAAQAMSNVARLPLLACPDPGSTAINGSGSTRLVHTTRREALLAAATDLVSERGFTAVTLSDIGASVGITASAVMRHFDSKEQLLGAAVNRAGEQLAGGVAAALRRSTSAHQGVEEIVTMYADFAVECREVVVILTTEAYSLSEAYRSDRRRRQRMYVKELAHVIAQTRAEATGAESRLRAGAVFALINEAVISSTLRHQPIDPSNLAALGLTVALGAADDPVG